jgi:L-asparagine oxygenase
MKTLNSTPNSQETIQLHPEETRAISHHLTPLLSHINSDFALHSLAPDIANALRCGMRSKTLFAIESFHQRPVCQQVIQGLPVDPMLIDTPAFKDPQLNSIALHAAIQVGYAVLRGEQPISYVEENAGRLIRHVLPNITADVEVSSHGAQKPLGAHTDNGFKPIAGAEACDSAPAPMTLTLLSLRNTAQIPTQFLLIDDVVQRMGESTLAALQEKSFIVQPPQSFANSASASEPLALLVYHSGKYWVRFDDAVHAFTKSAQEALLAFKNVLDDATLWHPILLQPDAAVCWKQNRVLHARSDFTPSYDGADRWLIRLYGLPSSYVKPVHAEIPFLML